MALTDEDDAGLWGAALARYWPDPGDPDAPVGGMVFTVGVVPPDGSDPERTRHGLVEVEVWRFERVDPARLRAFPIRVDGEDPRVPGPGEYPFGEVRYPLLYLDVERPSAETECALVHAGRQIAPLAGSGETRLWSRDEVGAWRPEDDPLLSWIS